jgi:hypothetical protein
MNVRFKPYANSYLESEDTEMDFKIFVVLLVKLFIFFYQILDLNINT